MVPLYQTRIIRRCCYYWAAAFGFGATVFFLATSSIFFSGGEQQQLSSLLSYKSEKNANLSLNSVEQDDPLLIHIIQENYLNPPSNEPYNLTSDKADPSYWQAKYVAKLLEGKSNGFFIECGASNGEFLSNTLMLEKVLGWEGALIEAFPPTYKELVVKHRKAWTIPACLSINSYAGTSLMKNVMYYEWSATSFIANSFWKVTNDTVEEGKEDSQGYKVQCFPLYSILLALNRPRIDFFSLDVEGNELNVLKTIPWEKVEITIICVEFYHVKEGKQILREYLESQGYLLYIDGSNLNLPQNFDLIFYNPMLLKNPILSNDLL